MPIFVYPTDKELHSFSSREKQKKNPIFNFIRIFTYEHMDNWPRLPSLVAWTSMHVSYDDFSKLVIKYVLFLRVAEL